MTVFLILIAGVFVIAFVGMLRKRQLVVKNLIVSIIALALIATHAIGTLVNRQNIKTFDEQLYSTLVAIPWGDTEYLESVGFNCGEDNDFPDYYRKSEQTLDAYTPCVQFSIQVRKKSKESVVDKRYDVFSYKDGEAYVKQSTALSYENFWDAFLGIPNGIDRDCSIYCNGYEIWIYEKNYESLNHSWAEEFIRDMGVWKSEQS